MRRPTHCSAARIAAILVAAGAGFGARASAQSLDRPIAQSWRATHVWSAAYEAHFGDFVAAIGRGVAAGRCHTLQRCLNNPTVNPLLAAGERPLRLHADCADVPYVLRAYFAYRNALPFVYAASLRGHGRDPRYMSAVRPSGLRRWTDFATPRALLQHVGDAVHSGYLRTAPGVENADFYQAAIDRGGIHPGTVYYDPNGHVLIVYEVRPDGEIRMFDGHPDNSVSHPIFSARYPVGTASTGGGFKNFRPFIVDAQGAVVQAQNASLADFAGNTPFERARYTVAGRNVGYHAWVRWRLSLTGPDSTVAARDSAPR